MAYAQPTDDPELEEPDLPEGVHTRQQLLETSETDSLSARMARVEAENVRQQSQIDSNKTHIGSLEERVDDLEEECRQLRKQVEEKDREIDELNKEKNVLIDELQNKQARIEELDEENKKLSAHGAEGKTKREVLQQKIFSLQTEVKDLRADMEQKAEELKKHSQERNDMIEKMNLYVSCPQCYTFCIKAVQIVPCYHVCCAWCLYKAFTDPNHTYIGGYDYQIPRCLLCTKELTSAQQVVAVPMLDRLIEISIVKEDREKRKEESDKRRLLLEAERNLDRSLRYNVVEAAKTALHEKLPLSYVS